MSTPGRALALRRLASTKRANRRRGLSPTQARARQRRIRSGGTRRRRRR